MTIKPRYWRLILVILSAAYLVPEAIFNAQLVSLIGLGTPKPEQLEHLEIYGRTVSGIGVTLLLADLLPTLFYRTVLRGILTISVVALLAWPTVFFGQKYLVEKLLVQPSTPEQRQFATLSAALRDALAANAVEISGLSYDPSELQSSENLTFLALFGGMTYADHNLADNLEQYKEKIIGNFVQKRAYAQFEQNYQDFGQLYKELSGYYQQYADGSNRYNQTLADIPQREQQYWQQVEQEVNSGWAQYQQAQKAQIAKAEARAQKYGPKIHDYFEAVGKCRERYDKYSERERRDQCITRLDARYKTEVSKAGFGYIEPDYWLIEEDVSTSENILTSIIGGVLTGGIYTGMQAISAATGGDGGFKDKRYKYTDDPEFYRNRFLALPKFQQLFTEQTGYPMGIGELNQFRLHDHTQELLRQKLGAKGLPLANDWQIGDRPGFYRAVAAKVKQDADKQWRSQMAKRGLQLPINLSWPDFQLHPAVQAKIADRMGDLYVDNIRADWSQANFKRYVVEPNIQKRTEQYIAMLKDAEQEFADGGKYAEHGKQALRSVIIPPISMSLSLFLLCMTIIKLPLKIAQLFSAKTPRTNADTEDSNQTPRRIANVPTTVWKVLPLLLLIALPPLLVSNRYTEQSDSPVNYFLGKVEQSGNIVMSYALRWTLHVQPLLHPLGLAFEQHTHIYKNFAPVAHVMAKWDITRQLLDDSDVRQAAEQLVKQQANLTINCNADDATIRIMNIGPRFSQGMRLTPGNYDIQVSAAGYQTYRRWHTVRAGEQQLSITLTPQG
ncbi:carboxypeptidase-like regulatory domain-containing protein [Shewanella sp. C32]|uniref:Carboxypeptidase-like regulatory domain-containing protein n=1 Tax=Shewanella electrica TaxID=515560 RepID=A0ABT2FPH4_9GAMM|nr:carboxypeptidase-like regulatory domain-containing protein [Shewanella electrica]MCH1926614.1 carboxypeptidase-like regulatory domain-containing protein [Shewanella electrica]MCS4558235.1 carboxypeptidase-like regulatory domain-containing protein [Shewanella electrica]